MVIDQNKRLVRGYSVACCVTIISVAIELFKVTKVSNINYFN